MMGFLWFLWCFLGFLWFLWCFFLEFSRVSVVFSFSRVSLEGRFAGRSGLV